MDKALSATENALHHRGCQTQALESARALQARLELLGDRANDVAIVRSLRDSLARDLGALGHRGDAEAVHHEQASGDYLIVDDLRRSASRSDGGASS